MTNHNATLRLFHSQESSEDDRSASPGRHEESGSVGMAHPVRATKHTVHDQRMTGHWVTTQPEPARLQSLAEIRVLAHTLAAALTARSEGVDASEWRLRVAAAQARAIEDILAGVDS